MIEPSPFHADTANDINDTRSIVDYFFVFDFHAFFVWKERKDVTSKKGKRIRTKYDRAVFNELVASWILNFTRKLLIPYFATTYAIRSPKTWPTFQRNRIGKPTRFNDHSLAKLLTSIFLVSECLDLFCDSRSCLDDRRNELPPKVERKG